MVEIHRRTVVAYFSLYFWIPARCSTVLAAAVLFAIQLRATSLLLLLPRIHTYITRTFLLWELAFLFRSCRRNGEG